MFKGVCVSGLLALVAAGPAAAGVPTMPLVVPVAGPADAEMALDFQPSEYWLGLECHPADATLRAQLKLDEDTGLVVRTLVPDSPAAKAGIQQHDVLVRAGGKELKGVRDLVEAVDAAGDRKLAVELVREAKRRKMDVAPAKRPEPETLRDRFLPLPVPGNPDWEAFRKWMEERKPGEEGPGPMRFRFIRPGMILPQGAPFRIELPEGLSIAITRKGSDPAEIVVKRGDEKWEVTEKELDKLPDDVREHVERLLGRGGKGFGIDLDLQTDRVIPMPRFEAPPPRALDKTLEERLERMHREIDELRKALEDRHAPTEKPRKK